MNTAHQLMEQLQREGASQFAQTALGRGHAGVVRTVRRQRATRATVLSVASVGVAGAAAMGIAHYGTTVTPAYTPTSPTTPTGEPSPSLSIPAPVVSVTVGMEEPIEKVARSLATAMGVTESEAYGAITAELPDEAGGYAEGWVLAGEYTFDPELGLESAAKQLVSMTTTQLEALGVPREHWMETVVLASVIQQEAPAARADRSAVARVLLNRLDHDMMLQIESPLAYYLRAEVPISDDAWAVDTPYNTYMYKGLPPSAIGAFTPDALAAAIDPADGDWLYFLRKEDGNVVLSTTFEEHQAAVEEEFPGTIGSN